MEFDLILIHILLIGGRYLVRGSTIPNNPRWLRPCFDPSLSILDYDSSEDSFYNGIMEDDAQYIQRHVHILTEECLTKVKNLKNSFTNSSCLHNTERRHFRLNSLLTNISRRISSCSLYGALTRIQLPFFSQFMNNTVKVKDISRQEKRRILTHAVSYMEYIHDIETHTGVQREMTRVIIKLYGILCGWDQLGVTLPNERFHPRSIETHDRQLRYDFMFIVLNNVLNVLRILR